MQHNYLLMRAPIKAFLLAMCVPFFASAQNRMQQQQIPLNDLSAFKNPTPNWSIAGSVMADFNKPDVMTKKDGQGILVISMAKERMKIYSPIWSMATLT